MEAATVERKAPAPASSPGASAVSVRDLTKAFRLPHQRYDTLKERVLHPFRTRSYEKFPALDDVSFDVAPGEFFGIVGRNGSGKSTLLKCIAGIYAIDSGRMDVNGRLSPFIELGVGFNPNLTARDNVLLNAVMLGLSRKQARERFDAIIEFAELEDFVDLELKNYSSGMVVRLGFSTAIQVDADILLIDEVLAVGDASFQQKCFDQFVRLREAGRTILFVTHSMPAVEMFCDRALLLEQGRPTLLGGPREVARAYNELNFGRRAEDEDEGAEGGPARAVKIERAWFEDPAGEEIVACGQGERVLVCADIVFNEAQDEPVLGFQMRNETGTVVFATSSQRHLVRDHYAAGDRVRLRVAFDNWLAPSRYRLTASVARHGQGADILDIREDAAAIQVHGGIPSGGLADLPHTFDVEPR